jgi:uncharacterized protein
VKTITLLLIFLIATTVTPFCKVHPPDTTRRVKFYPIPVSNVKVAGEIGRRIDLLWANEVAPLDLDAYVLRYFKHKVSGSEEYRGLGKLLHAHVLYALYTRDKKVIERKDYLVKETIRIQDEDGYTGLMNTETRLFQGFQGLPWDVHEMSYIIIALSQNYKYFNDVNSLMAAKKAADYIISNWKKSAGWEKPLTMEESMLFTALEEAMVTVYDLTRDKRYLSFLLDQRKIKEWNLDIEIGRGPLNRGHIYSYLVRAIAQLKLYAIEGSPELLSQSYKALDFLVNQHGLTITGGSGQKENWDDSQDGRGSFAESCATIHFIWLCDQLIQLTGKSYFGDLMERAIYNSLFAALSPNCQLTRYYTPFEGEREYWTGGSYCCNNNLRRVMPMLPGMVFYRNAKAIIVNLYTDAEAAFQLTPGNNLRIRQATSYPGGQEIRIHLSPEKAQSFDLMLRVPAWSKKTIVKINGNIIDSPATPGEFLVLNRKWKRDDVVEMRFEMNSRLINGVRRQAGRVALMRGPVLYCLNNDNAGTYGELDGATLSQITLNPRSFQFTQDSSTVRPDGTAYSVEVWPPADERRQAVNLPRVLLTEFPDPKGKAVYFKLFHFDYFKDGDLAQSDELFPLPFRGVGFVSLFEK